MRWRHTFAKRKPWNWFKCNEANSHYERILWHINTEFQLKKWVENWFGNKSFVWLDALRSRNYFFFFFKYNQFLRLSWHCSQSFTFARYRIHTWKQINWLKWKKERILCCDGMQSKTSRHFSKNRIKNNLEMDFLSISICIKSANEAIVTWMLMALLSPLAFVYMPTKYLE